MGFGNEDYMDGLEAKLAEKNAEIERLKAKPPVTMAGSWMTPEDHVNACSTNHNAREELLKTMIDVLTERVRALEAETHSHRKGAALCGKPAHSSCPPSRKFGQDACAECPWSVV